MLPERQHLLPVPLNSILHCVLPVWTILYVSQQSLLWYINS